MIMLSLSKQYLDKPKFLLNTKITILDNSMSLNKLGEIGSSWSMNVVIEASLKDVSRETMVSHLVWYVKKTS